MDNRYGITRQGSGIWRSLRNGDFEEDDVWDVLTSIETTNKKESISNSKIGKKPKESSSISVPRRNISSSAARMIPRGANGSISISSSNNSSSNNETKMMMIQQSSAPVNIPADWSQIPKRKPTKKTTNSWLQDDDDDDCYDQNSDEEEEEEEEEEEGEYNYKLPPHEVIAKRLARSQISSFSVFEGVGRKLKGRDLSKVRNAVLVRTGFLESP